jgi:uncharacterized protein YndB with AHSA1/START domain
MIETVVTREIARPADEVFAFVADASNNPRWQFGMQRCTRTSEPPIRVGSTYDQHARFLGRDIVSTFEVVELVPDRRIRIRTLESPMPIDVVREVEPLAAGRARVRATVRGGPTGTLRLLDPLTKVLVQRSVRRDYERLAALLSRTDRPEW